MWRERVGERRPAACAAVGQFVEAGQALDAARGPSRAHLVPRCPSGAQRPARAGLEARSSSGAQRSTRAGSVSRQLRRPQGSPAAPTLPCVFILLLGVIRRLVIGFNCCDFSRRQRVHHEHVLSRTHHDLVGALDREGHRSQCHLERGGRGRGVELVGLGRAQVEVGGSMVSVLRETRRSAAHAEVSGGHLAHHLLLDCFADLGAERVKEKNNLSSLKP